MTIETFDMEEIELIYRDDYSSCFPVQTDDPSTALLGNADVIVLASNDVPLDCVEENMRLARATGSILFYAGPKHFGYNLNWLARVDEDARKNQYNPLPSDIAQAEMAIAAIVPTEHFISLLSPTLKDGRVPITDELGRLISTDRAHLTRHGAPIHGQAGADAKRVWRSLASCSFRPLIRLGMRPSACRVIRVRERPRDPRLTLTRERMTSPSIEQALRLDNRRDTLSR
jgi:hypothetical protein